VGDDPAGVAIRNGLKAEKVDVRYVHAFEEARSSTSAVIVDGHGERMIITQRDTSIPAGTSWLPIERVAEASAVLCDLRWLEAVRVVLTRARREGIPTILDADLGGREALPELLALVDYAVFSAPSLHEFARGMSDVEALQQVMRHGPRHAGVTLGPRGYLWAERDGRSGHQPAFQVDVVDTTGAGDAFHGAFALGVAEGLPIEATARQAAAVAALKCTRLGSRAGLPTRSELDLFVALHGG
jgi:sulfofructose kinase